MNTQNQVKGVPVKRWLDVALLTYTLAGPFVNILTKRLGQSGRTVQTTQEDVQTTQPDIRQRLNELTLETRQWVAEQVQQLNEQARQLQAQSRQLRKATRRESKQRRKLLAQLRESGVDLSKDMLERSEQLTEELVERGGKITQDLLERSGELTQELAKRGGKITHDLAERGEHLLEPVRKRDRNFWAIVGFGVGLVVAGVVTYRLVRQRVMQSEMEQDEHIELPQSDSWNGAQSRPAGEIRHIDEGGISVATLEIVDVETNERPDDAAFVGVVSTRLYYPVDTTFEPEDVVYFISEEEARAQGFIPAE
jgi:hypothetical protein